MAKNKAKHYSEKPLDSWNAADFSRYIADENEKRFGIPCTVRNVAQERAMIKRFYETYGKDAAKAFVDACIRTYNASPAWPTVNFGFMASYMKERVLPPILAEQKRKQAAIATAEAVNGGMSVDELEAWL